MMVGVRRIAEWARTRTVTWTILALLVALLGGGAYVLFWPHPVRLTGVTLEFAPLGSVDANLLRDIAQETAGVYGVPYRVIPVLAPIPAEARDGRSGKYWADMVLASLKRRPILRGVHQLGIAEADVTVADMNFVFGLADMPGTTAVMSLARLRPMKPGANAGSLLRERAVKIAVHELGHTFGFRHCPNERCVMSYTVTAAGVDRADRTFCPQCRSRLRH